MARLGAIERMPSAYSLTESRENRAGKESGKVLFGMGVELGSGASNECRSAATEEFVHRVRGGFPVVARAPRTKLVQLMQSDAAGRIKVGKHGDREVVILSDTAVLWPPTDAGCFDSEDEDTGEGDESGIESRRNNTSSSGNTADTSSKQEVIDPETKAELLRRVVSHLSGLERERDLIRAASVSSTSDGRRRGTSGAIRERGSAGGNGKRDMRNGLLSAGTSKNRVVSSPIMQQRSTSASSYASSTTESTKWSNWGSVFSGLGKFGLRGNADTR